MQGIERLHLVFLLALLCRKEPLLQLQISLRFRPWAWSRVDPSYSRIPAHYIEQTHAAPQAQTLMQRPKTADIALGGSTHPYEVAQRLNRQAAQQTSLRGGFVSFPADSVTIPERGRQVWRIPGADDVDVTAPPTILPTGGRHPRPQRRPATSPAQEDFKRLTKGLMPNREGIEVSWQPLLLLSLPPFVLLSC